MSRLQGFPSRLYALESKVRNQRAVYRVEHVISKATKNPGEIREDAMEDIAGFTFGPDLIFSAVVATFRSTLTKPKPKNALRVRKALMILKYCLYHGSEEFLMWVRNHDNLIGDLKAFEYTPDRKIYERVRRAAKKLHESILDEVRLRSLRLDTGAHTGVGNSVAPNSRAGEVRASKVVSPYSTLEERKLALPRAPIALMPALVVMSGYLGYKASEKNSVGYSYTFFWLVGNRIKSRRKESRLHGGEHAPSGLVAASADDLKMGLLCFDNSTTRKSGTFGVLELEHASQLFEENRDEFGFHISQDKHQFRTASPLLRSRWMIAIKKIILENHVMEATFEPGTCSKKQEAGQNTCLAVDLSKESTCPPVDVPPQLISHGVRNPFDLGINTGHSHPESGDVIDLHFSWAGAAPAAVRTYGDTIMPPTHREVSHDQNLQPDDAYGVALDDDSFASDSLVASHSDVPPLLSNLTTMLVAKDDQPQQILERRPSFRPVTSKSPRMEAPLSLTPASAIEDAASQQDLAGRLNTYFVNEESPRSLYSDTDIQEISDILKLQSPRWSKVPRTYVVLRIIGQLDLLNHCIDVGFSDYWFPVTERSLPDILRPSIRGAFVAAQSLVLTPSMNLEKGENGQHCYFRRGETLPFEMRGVLGSGGHGQVDKVLSLISFKEYARKRVLRSVAFRGRKKEDVTQFIAEIEILKRLKHRHVVEFVGSYTDAKYIGLIMSPVADGDLTAYLLRVSPASFAELRTLFGCLATALEFLHLHNVRHKDIKPGNILVSNGKVLVADFGLSFDFTDATGSTTMSMVNGMTPRYCAPEVANHEPRNTMSDIWSLGVVFLEMVVTLKGETTQYMDNFLRQRGSEQAFIRLNSTALPELFTHLATLGNWKDNKVLGWIEPMLSMSQKSRPTASALAAQITSSMGGGVSTSFCGICCVVEDDEDFSDYASGSE